MNRRKNPSKLNRKHPKGKYGSATSIGSELVQRQNSAHPIISLPEVTISPKYVVTKRFVNNSALVSGGLTLADLFNQFMVVTSSSAGVAYIRALRIRKLRILSPVTTQGTSVELSIQPNGFDNTDNNFNSMPETYKDTSASIDVPAYIALKPKVDTPLGSWHYALNTNTTQSLCIILAPKGSTMDIQFEFILNDQNLVSNYSVVLAAATAGTLFSRNMITNFVPLQYNVL